MKGYDVFRIDNLSLLLEYTASLERMQEMIHHNGTILTEMPFPKDVYTMLSKLSELLAKARRLKLAFEFQTKLNI